MELRVRNWDRFQHYTKRNPPWIRLYRDLLDDVAFWSLDPYDVRLLLAIWLLASQGAGDGRLRLDSTALAWRLRLASADIEKAINRLVAAGFLVASTMLAECKQNAIPDPEAEADHAEAEADAERARDPFASSFAQFPERVVEAYREHCPNLPQPAPGWRRGSTAAGILRLSDEIGQDIGVWVDVFQIANNAAFLREKRLGLDWLVKTPENWQNTASGRYSDVERADPFAVLEGGAA